MDSVTQGAFALGPVVAGTDGSEEAMKGVLWAAEGAAVRKQPLTIVHALGVEQAGYLAFDDSHRILDIAKQILDESAARVSQQHPQVTVSTVPSRDEAAESLLEAAGSDGTIVVGSRGLGGFAALLLGSVGLRVAALSHPHGRLSAGTTATGHGA
nr:universal stress protein [Streptomyces sp. NBC_00857]